MINFSKLVDVFSPSTLSFKKCVGKVPFDGNVYSVNDIGKWSKQLGLIIPNGYVMIDIDERGSADKVSSWLDDEGIKRVEVKSPRGRHFYFKTGGKRFKNQANVRTHLHSTFYDLRIDVRAEAYNGKQAGYAIIPYNTPDRTFEHEDEPDVIPSWLIPRIGGESTAYDLSGDVGGRNNELLRYTLHLRDTSNLTASQTRDIIKFINKKWTDPLDDSEISTILRDENVKAPKKEENNEKNIALHILNDYQIKKKQKTLYIFDGQLYRKIDEDYIRSLVLREYDESLKFNKRNEIYNFIYDICAEEIEDNDANKFILSTPDFLVDLETGDHLHNDGTLFITSGINYSPKENVKSKFAEKYMNDLFGDDVETIYQMIGYSFMRTLTFRKSLWLLGSAGTGKSFFIDVVLRKIYSSVSDVSIRDINSNFGAEQLSDSLVNFIDDADITSVKDANKFKSAVSGNTITSDRKFKSAIAFRPIATWFVSTNTMPEFYEKDDSIYDRLIIVEMKNKIKKDPFLESKIDDKFIIHIINKSILAAKKIIEEKKITYDESATRAFSRFNNNVYEFMKDPNVKIDNISCKGVFSQYKDFCDENSYRKVSKRDFEKTIEKKYDKVHGEGRILTWKLK